MSEQKAKVMSYYAFIDEEQFDDVKALFSEDAVYKRCEDIFLGKPEVVEYLTEKRKLKGKHQILKLNEDENTVIVRGIFEGKNGEGKHIRVFFSDFFSFNEDELIFTRETYLANGIDLIQ